jgi:tRNA-2-methylthio-N6-dimethylallyladenosine synthase
MQGCNNFCTYCVVPYTRGREVSRKVKDILDEAHALVDAGICEITLLGQNVNSYGRTNLVTPDGSSFTFSQLLCEVAAIRGLKRLRFTTSNPKDLSSELMRCFGEIDILCPQFHLPVQSGSNAVLSRMNRKYTRELYLQQVEELRSFRPDIAISTDVIVGFPGESDADFELTMELLEEVRFHSSFSFKYSDRPGTRSADFADKVDEPVKSERLSRFQHRQDEICLEQNLLYVEKVLPVMIEKLTDNGMVGRTDSNHIVHIEEKIACIPGDIVSVLIYHAGRHSLNGRLNSTHQKGAA